VHEQDADHVAVEDRRGDGDAEVAEIVDARGVGEAAAADVGLEAEERADERADGDAPGDEEVPRAEVERRARAVGQERVGVDAVEDERREEQPDDEAHQRLARLGAHPAGGREEPARGDHEGRLGETLEHLRAEAGHAPSVGGADGAGKLLRDMGVPDARAGASGTKGGGGGSRTRVFRPVLRAFYMLSTTVDLDRSWAWAPVRPICPLDYP